VQVGQVEQKLVALKVVILYLAVLQLQVGAMALVALEYLAGLVVLAVEVGIRVLAAQEHLVKVLLEVLLVLVDVLEAVAVLAV
jgi:hypothetical protein